MKVKGEEFITGNQSSHVITMFYSERRQSSHVITMFYSEREKEPEITTSEIEVKVKEISSELCGMREKS